MALRETVFGSKSEERVFEHLGSVWKDKFNVFHNLPFAQIFDMDTIDLKRYGKNSYSLRQFLFKSSVDYIVCDKKNKPLMCIEFDGMCGGYNRGTEYLQNYPNRRREDKLELKLRIARDHAFPFYIVSYEETEPLSKKSIYDLDLNLTVVDAIIGQTMAHCLLPDKVEEYLDLYEDSLSSMSEYERDEFIQERVINAEVDLELTWDPVAIKAAKLEGLLYAKGILTSGHGYRFIEKPEAPDIKGLHDYEGIKKRVEAMEKVEWQGCEVNWETPDGTIVKEVWIRNFKGTEASPLTIVQNIADLLTLYEVAKRYQVEIPNDI